MFTTTTTTTTTRDRGDRYGPMEWAQLYHMAKTEAGLLERYGVREITLKYDYIMH